MPIYAIHLRPKAGCNIPGPIALRRLLKALGRGYGLECVAVLESPQDESGDAGAVRSPERPPEARHVQPAAVPSEGSKP